MRTNAPRARRLRLLEATLLVGVALLFVFGGLLAVVTKPPPSGTVYDINHAAPAQIARLLHASETRLRAGQGQFRDVDQLARAGRGSAPIVAPEVLRNHRDQLVVRDPRTARWQLAGSLASLIALGIVGHLAMRRFRPFADPIYLPGALFLAGVGILTLYAIKDPDRDQLAFAAQTSGIWLAGLVAAVCASGPFWRRPWHRYGYVCALAAVGLLGVLALFGGGPGGVRLAVFGVQPVEAVKVLLVLFVAAYFAERGPAFSGSAKFERGDLIPVASLYVVPLALFALLRDLGPALLLFGAFLAMLFAATNRRRYLLVGAASTVAGGVAGYFLRIGTVPTRIAMWLSPWDNGYKGGDQVAAGLWAMASGGGLGSGLGLGEAARVPRAGSDMVFASIGCDGGLPATLLVLGVTGALVARGLRTALHADSDFRRLLAIGLIALLGFQTLLIVAGTLGLFPLSGVSFPWVAYGKSALMAQGAILGMLIAISDQEFPRTAARSTETAHRRLLLTALSLYAVCIVRLLQVQILAADRIAALPLRTREADGVRRYRRNPRLERLAQRIPRGRIVDRNGFVLAETRDGVRRITEARIFAHVVGWTDPAFGGPTYAERNSDPELRGYESYRDLVYLWRRKDLPGFQLPTGQDVRLSVDADLQRRSYRALSERGKDVRGAVLALDPHNGEVLVAVSLPTVDTGAITSTQWNRWVTDARAPLLPRATAGKYPPGSTFKIVTAAALLEGGKADFTTRCDHTVRNLIWQAAGKTFARRSLRDDESEIAHGAVNLTEAVTQSCNVYFARAGIQLGTVALSGTAEAMGVGMPQTSDIDSALPETAIGQGALLVTPLSMARAVATIANQGRLVEPVWLAGKPGDSTKALEPTTADRLSEMLERVTRAGTAAGRFDGLGFTVAGKTGTAQNSDGDRKPHGWFVGYAPAREPRIAFAVIVEHGGYGAQTAAPIARAMLRGLE